MKNIDITTHSKISIEEALKIKNSAWVDVRCPREYKRGHFSNSFNIPIFSDSEYENLGITYRSKGQNEAILLGKKYVKKSIKNTLSKFSSIKNKNLIIYCARGGMRSNGMEHIIKKTNYNCYTINRGYKSVRSYTLSTFNQKRNVIILAGSTGTGKTQILQEMKLKNSNIIDLESLAKHRGSVFGDLGLDKQPSQQQFENNLSFEWINTNPNYPVFIESESRKIGRVVIPEGIWSHMENGYYIKIDMNFKRRVKNLLNEYGHYNKSDLKDRVERISTRLGGAETKEAIDFIEKDDLSGFCKLLLNRYYDKLYDRAYNTRKLPKKIIKIHNETNSEIINKIHRSI